MPGYRRRRRRRRQGLPIAPEAGAPDAVERFVGFAYWRENPAGPHRELWYHAAGCRSWLEVERDTRTHEIVAAAYARTGAAR